MRKVIKKWFWTWEFEKEEKWLNEMAAKGLALVDCSFCRYSFEECEPGEYSFKIQLLENRPSHPESENYIRFMEETGAEQVASYINWVYFRKKNDGVPFELFSDFESQIKHLLVVKKLLLPLGFINLFFAFSNFINFWLNAKELVWLPLINLALAVVLALGAWRIQKKINVLKKESAIRE